MSTSVVARGKIVMAETEGRPIPAGWAIDVDGNPTVDPSAALTGAVLPMAGYKGAGLALMIDILSGVLTGAAFGTHVVDLYDRGSDHQDVGHFFIAIAVDAFMSIEAFRLRIQQYIDEVRGQPRLPGVDRIYVPGELEFAAARRAERDGVAVSGAGWAVLNELADRWAVAPLDDRLSRLAPAS
jgi:LDH2 family malate/lactate/ureidoglycolate dehydrogenase